MKQLKVYKIVKRNISFINHPVIQLSCLYVLFATGDATNWKLTSCRDTPKKCVQLVFIDDENSFLVADKFGDVLQLSCDKPDQEASVVLGHLSMLMDIALLSDNTLLATADRDEKIRISHFPNTYNIQVLLY